jgi:hypothetical protein
MLSSNFPDCRKLLLPRYRGFKASLVGNGKGTVRMGQKGMEQDRMDGMEGTRGNGENKTELNALVLMGTRQFGTGRNKTGWTGKMKQGRTGHISVP